MQKFRINAFDDDDARQMARGACRQESGRNLLTLDDDAISIIKVEKI